MARTSNLITYFILGLTTGACYFLGFWQVRMKWFPEKPDRPERVYQSLHALEYPKTALDLSIISFSTPALPSRLASAWEIQNALKMPSNALAAVQTLIYPMMEVNLGMLELLKANTKLVNGACLACEAQQIFKFGNVLFEDQTQHFCPKRGETRADWAKRTGQVDSNDIETTYDEFTKFNYNSEHSHLCRASRSPAMALAHVPANAFTLFSSHNGKILLMYVAIVNALFACAIFLYRWHGTKLSDSSTEHKFELHGLFSFLFFIAAMMSLLPLLIDYYERNDGSPVSVNRAAGSYVLGIWTIVFTFVYIKVFPLLIPPQEPPGATDAEQAKATTPIIEITKDKDIVLSFISRQPMISFAYWNLMQVPCFVMLALTRVSYGVDVSTQFIVFGALAVVLLDVLHARVIVILAILRKTSGPDSRKLDWFVWLLFVFAKLCIAMPVWLKMNQANMSVASILVVAALFFVQTLQNAGVLISLRHKAYDNDLRNYIKAHDAAFVASLVVHVVVTGVAFLSSII
jgi:hypothetical protein